MREAETFLGPPTRVVAKALSAMSDPLTDALASASIDEIVTVTHPTQGDITLVARVDEGGSGLEWVPAEVGTEEDLLQLHLKTKLWMAPMLRDAERNAKYETAIARAMKRLGQRSLPLSSPFQNTDQSSHSTLALDIGTGTGLLAMLAARGGASNVVACEMFPAMAKLAESTVAANGCGVDVFCAHSSALTTITGEPSCPNSRVGVGKGESSEYVVSSDPTNSCAKQEPTATISTLLPGRADFLSSELLDSTLLGLTRLFSYHQIKKAQFDFLCMVAFDAAQQCFFTLNPIVLSLADYSRGSASSCARWMGPSP